jgi:2-polyprenyl-3-methyl-5-hydroxy-6-metoxy-1,4-benzoquinol methylase
MHFFGLVAYDCFMETVMKRQVTAELMDAPDVDQAEHERALRALRRLNRLSGAVGMVAAPIYDLALRQGLLRLSILDVACGGGDVPVGVARQLNAAGIEASLLLTDRSLTALSTARHAAESTRLPAHCVLGDAPDGLPDETCDFVTNSLFLHHLERAQVVATLAAMARRARGALVVADLRRSRFGAVVAWVICRLVTRSPIVHFDGPVSVRAAWTPEELKAMAAEAGLKGAQVRRRWPWRMVLVWERAKDAG